LDRTHLVSNADGAARVTNPQLINPLGHVSQPQQCVVVSDQRTGSSTVYKGAGTKQSLSIAIPPSDPNYKSMPTGTPTGTTFNSSQRDFLLAPDKPAIFLFSTIETSVGITRT
jgi:hypothetical protein